MTAGFSVADDAVDIQSCAGCGGTINRLAAGWLQTGDGRAVHEAAGCVGEVTRRAHQRGEGVTLSEPGPPIRNGDRSGHSEACGGVMDGRWG